MITYMKYKIEFCLTDSTPDIMPSSSWYYYLSLNQAPKKISLISIFPKFCGMYILLNIELKLVILSTMNLMDEMKIFREFFLLTLFPRGEGGYLIPP